MSNIEKKFNKRMKKLFKERSRRELMEIEPYSKRYFKNERMLDLIGERIKIENIIKKVYEETKKEYERTKNSELLEVLKKLDFIYDNLDKLYSDEDFSKNELYFLTAFVLSGALTGATTFITSMNMSIEWGVVSLLLLIMTIYSYHNFESTKNRKEDAYKVEQYIDSISELDKVYKKVDIK